MSNPIPVAPLDRLDGLKQNWKNDIVSGFILFLIALPLSLGIAMASGMPPMAGIIAAMVGGLFVSQISGSYVTINGPAAGLIVVILSSVDRLGGGSPGYHATLAAIVVSGVLLFVMGLFKAGELGKFFPASVVHGMLASIGIVIMLKQFPVMLGVAPPAREPIELFLKMPFTIIHANPEIAAIGVLSMAILIGLTFVKGGILRKIPAPIIVVMAACALGFFFHMTTAHTYSFCGHSFEINPLKCLVQVPTNMATAFAGPDFSAISRNEFWLSVLSITLVQGIETVLSCAAVDKLDPYKRHANLSRDLSAVGLGSALSGMMGGLPVIAEIVRSTANITNGAKTRWSNFFHGLFVLTFVLLAASLINSIPLASLAALLCFTGYRLASPRVWRDTHSIGWEQTLLFLVTIVFTLATDLLIGVAAGVAVKFLLHLLGGVQINQLFKANVVIEHPGSEQTVVRICDAAIFSNYLSIKKYLAAIAPKQAVIIDLSHASFIDHTVMEHLENFAQDQMNSGGSCKFTGLEFHQSVSKHPTSTRKQAFSTR